MKKIKIVNRWDKDIILICDKYENIKDCLEKNRDADLRGADLRGADLRGADLRGADLRDADLRGADLRGADLRGADLEDAYLRGADLEDAYLRGAYLEGADLRGAKNYYNSHDFAIELIHRQPIETFNDKEWQIIGIISIYRLCWDTICKRYKRQALSICRKLAKLGFDEYLTQLKMGLKHG